MEKKIKWGCIQPLTGGMYIGALNAIGHNAEWILSYPDLCDEKNGKCGNEYHLIKWLEKHNVSVPYYTFNRAMFQDDYDLNPEIIGGMPDYTDMDLVIAVPVCSGLSMVTSASQETKDTRNCNMLYLTKYTLSVIRPKIYIFENAPTLMGSRGDNVRYTLEEMASENGYSVLYYKTDTVFHNNCQKRQRTFVIFQKWSTDRQESPLTFNFEDKTIYLNDYIQLIPEGASQQIPFNLSPLNVALMNYTQHKYGVNWRELSHNRPMIDLVNSGCYDDFLNYVDSMDVLSDAEKEKLHKFINHVIYKKSLGLNFMSIDIFIPKNTIPSIQFKCIQSILHPTENRLLTVRECLHFMGMPDDFELQGNIESNYAQIGQNVPVKTAEFIVKEAINILNKEHNKGNNVIFQDNIKKNIS